MVIVLNHEIIAAKEGIVKQYEDSGIKVIVEIPMSVEERDRNGMKAIKRMLNNELLLQISNKGLL